MAEREYWFNHPGDVSIFMARLIGELIWIPGVDAETLKTPDGIIAEVRRVRAIVKTRDELARENARLRRLVGQDEKLP